MSILSEVKSFLLPNSQPTIRFACTIPGYEIGQPVRKAADMKPDWFIKQKESAKKNGHPEFSACPGMHDYFRAGYIIPAWEDFRIVVDEKHAHIEIGKTGKDAIPFERMADSVVKGIVPIDEDMKLHALKIPCPWKVFTKPGYSAYVMPALYHSPFLRDLYLYSGINDYDMYHTINVMFTPMKEIDVTIYAGTPMLQVIPYKREDITCEVGSITQKEIAEAEFTYRTKQPAFYRRFLHRKKKYDLINT